MQRIQTGRKGERGNVLFLILIAVALFAALSYAVTQSSRSGGGDANKETNLVNSAQLTQYPAGVRTAIVRMIISNNVAVSELEFNPPSDFGAGKDIDDTLSPTKPSVLHAVFHPLGGGATYTQSPADVMASSQPGTWHFSQEFNIPNVGTTQNDLIAYLSGVSSSVCDKINEQLGISSTPVLAAVVVDSVDQISDGTDQDVPVVTAAAADTDIGAGVDGQPFACFRNGAAGPYVYYHVLIEQ